MAKASPNPQIIFEKQHILQQCVNIWYNVSESNGDEDSCHPQNQKHESHSRRIKTMAKQSEFFTAEEREILSQRGKAAWNNLSDEEKQARIEQSKANNKQAAMTDEQRAELSAAGKAAWNALSDEEKQARIEQSKANNKQTPMTDEQRKAASEAGKARWEALSQEEKNAQMAKAKAGMFKDVDVQLDASDLAGLDVTSGLTQ